MNYKQRIQQDRLWVYMLDEQFPRFLVPNKVREIMGIDHIACLPRFNFNLKREIIQHIFYLMNKNFPHLNIMDLSDNILILELFYEGGRFKPYLFYI